MVYHWIFTYFVPPYMLHFLAGTDKARGRCDPVAQDIPSSRLRQALSPQGRVQGILGVSRHMQDKIRTFKAYGYGPEGQKDELEVVLRHALLV